MTAHLRAQWRAASHPPTSIVGALAGLDLPECARDGECISVSGAILTRLKTAGFRASLATVWGWMAPGLIGFLHNAVRVDSDADGPFIVDATATQFESTLPSLIIAPLDDYVALMTKATRVVSVSVT